MSDQAELDLLPNEPEDRDSLQATNMEADTTPPADGNGDDRSIPDGPLKRLVDHNFLQYASYVIRDRAIPDLDDGLKPVQRRILHSLHENDDGKFIKVANIVGYCMQYHPHGDASIEDALVSLTNRGFLIEGQGNFGNLLTGDPAAASRYIECRLTDLARHEIFNDDLTSFAPTYDGRRQEPLVLPAKLPLLLMLGADGIAVGVSTRILPHNFRELIEAQVSILHKEPFRIVPDFLQGGLMDTSGYEEGRGTVRVRARIEKADAQTLIIREVPFGITTDALIASIEDAGRKGKLKIRGISDFTAERVQIEILLQPEQDADRAIEALYVFTQCEVQLSSRIVIIRDGRPAEMDVPAILRHNTERLLDILKKELRLEHRRLMEEWHHKTLIQIFIEQHIYKRLENCKTHEEMTQTLHDGLTPFRPQLHKDIAVQDIEMLLSLPIRRISQFDLDKNRTDLARLTERTAEVEKELASLVPYAVRYLRNLVRKYGELFPRRTEIARFAEVEVRELTAGELHIGYDRAKGYLGSKVSGETALECSSYDKIIIFWKDGRFRTIPPPEKLFVDSTVLHIAIADRDRIMTAVYQEEGFTRIKRFATGGTIQNRDYHFVPKGSEVRFLTDTPTPILYVRYTEGKHTIKQQEFHTSEVPVRDREARGLTMTSKAIESLGMSKPSKWDDTLTGPKGTYMDLL
jgi:topoisomerase-4 subunit A